ncbi:uncharacterized protein LOC112588153 [Harpegnathos saltator]|uniref:uncharacterized protein LOC112588153 n=1 Tax=Harpegnathos saltator TaxID=610380 RepID=UPI000DBECFA2|nr:uncharacterized protein LOC112588153 [Harpegnathos saltator]
MADFRQTMLYQRSTRFNNEQDSPPKYTESSPPTAPVFNTRGRNRQRIGTQLQEARDKFAEIAENHTTTLRLHAEASMKLADSALLAAQNDLQLKKEELQSMNSKLKF